MTRARYIGDPRHGGQGPDAVNSCNYSFVKGEWREIDAAAAERLSKNNHFELDGDDDGEADPALAEVRAQLTELGVKFHHRAGLDKLMAKLDEATR